MSRRQGRLHHVRHHGELTKWAELRAWGERNRAKLQYWMHSRPILGYNVNVARVWGELSAAAQRRGRPSPPNDTWIAACCLVAGLPLATRNTKDYADFAAHHGLVLL
jgi:predicted nucleic acid-binding protein